MQKFKLWIKEHWIHVLLTIGVCTVVTLFISLLDTRQREAVRAERAYAAAEVKEKTVVHYVHITSAEDGDHGYATAMRDLEVPGDSYTFLRDDVYWKALPYVGCDAHVEIYFILCDDGVSWSCRDFNILDYTVCKE